VRELWPWLVVFGLGVFHGINPAMGWLFAVALGLQEQKRAAVLRALPPIALGTRFPSELSLPRFSWPELVCRTQL
jgi:hypothetical protein